MVIPDAGSRTDVLGVEGGIHVALVGLAPVYAHGLRLGLVSAGLPCLVLQSAAELPALLTPDQCLVAVLSVHEGAALSALQLVGRPGLEAVHVLLEASAQAYSNALRAGATGAFLESAELPQVIRTIRSAAVGYTLLPAGVAKAFSRPHASPRHQLEQHELTYLRVLADGATVSGLARQAGYSEREMYRLLSGMYSRLGAHNRTEALLLAERMGLLEEETG